MIKNICTATDDAYILGAKVLMASISRATNETFKSQLKINLAYQHGSLSSENIEKLQKISHRLGLNLELHSFESEITDEDLFQGGQKIKHISSTTLAKFYFFESMNDPFLWLDADIAVRTGWEKLLGYGDELSVDMPYLVVGQNPSHFNAGVMGCLGGAPVVDWKRRVGRHVSNIEQHIFVNDLSDSSVRVSKAFNSLSIWGSRSRTKESFVIHYAGPIKPWHFRSSLWASCISSACGWHTWYLAAEYLANFDTEVNELIKSNAAPPLPRNSSLQANVFLRLINLKSMTKLSLAISFLLRRLNSRKNLKLHPMCSPES